MLQSIWIPKWLYKGLPWAAIAVGGVGLWIGGFVMMCASVIVSGYGACVLAERATYTGVYHHG